MRVRSIVVRVEISAAAAADLIAIWLYGAQTFGPEVADRYAADFERSFALVGRHPGIGAIEDRVRPAIRSLPCGSHRIFYDMPTDCVMVQRVLHKAMAVERWL